LPQVVARVGIDMNVLHVEREADRRWLRALIWPEHAGARALGGMADRNARNTCSGLRALIWQLAARENCDSWRAAVLAKLRRV
jgi:hypothetical protein